MYVGAAIAVVSFILDFVLGQKGKAVDIISATTGGASFMLMSLEQQGLLKEGPKETVNKLKVKGETE